MPKALNGCPDLIGYSHIGPCRSPDDVGALLERVVVVGVVGRGQAALKTRQLRGRRKKCSEGERRLSERPTVGVDVDDDVQRDDQDGQEAEAELFSEQLHLGTQQDRLRRSES